MFLLSLQKKIGEQLFEKTHLRKHFSNIDIEILYHPINLKFWFFDERI